jgi:hypothetical protein
MEGRRGVGGGERARAFVREAELAEMEMDEVRRCNVRVRERGEPEVEA